MSKPVVKIHSAQLVAAFSSALAGKGQILTGKVEEYPEGHGKGDVLSYQWVRTSMVVSVSEDRKIVETMNTEYHVQSWVE